MSNVHPIRPLNHFAALWQLGYRHLIPIVPPGAPVSEKSTLFKKVGTPQDSRGKTPGIRGRDGLWRGMGWIHFEATEADLATWHAMGAGVGLKCGRDGMIAIDADTLDVKLANLIHDVIKDELGLLPVRVGNRPKAAYLCRVDEPLPYMRVEFGRERVEVLTEGRQVVLEGLHPKTGAPYYWLRPLPSWSDLPVFPAAKIVALLERLRGVLPEASEVKREGGLERAEVDQDSLRGDPDLVRRAVEALPNTSELFLSRESWRDVGYAIKAALPDDPAAALELFQDWCARWKDGTNDPAYVEAEWRRFKPPFRRGARWLYELAEKFGPAGAFSSAEQWFEPVTSAAAGEIFPKAFEGTFPVLRIGEIISRPPPVFLVDRHIPEGALGFVHSEPGAGKSFLCLDQGLAVAHGLPDWHGDRINADPSAAVLYLAAEGSFDMRNRISAWLQERGLKASDRFFLIEQPVNFMAPDDIAKLIRTVQQDIGRPLCLTFVDTVSRMLPGADENLQKDMTRFVAACGRIQAESGAAVVGVHHTSKAGTMRGSTVLQGAGDFVFRLERKPGATVGRLTCEKMKSAPDGWEEPYRFGLVQLPDGQTSLVPERCDAAIGPEVAITPSLTESVLAAMRAAWDVGAPWSKHPQGKERFAIRIMCRDFGFDAVRAEELLTVWEQSGLIAESLSDRHSKARGYRVIADIMSSQISILD